MLLIPSRFFQIYSDFNMVKKGKYPLKKNKKLLRENYVKKIQTKCKLSTLLSEKLASLWVDSQ